MLSESHRQLMLLPFEVTSLESGYARILEMIQQSRSKTSRKTTGTRRRQLTAKGPLRDHISTAEEQGPLQRPLKP